MADRLLFRSGGVTVEIDDIGADLLRRVIERVAPGLEDEIRRATSEVVRGAERDWPVGRDDDAYLKRNPHKRGRTHSRDLFRTEVVVERSGYNDWKVTGRIWNGAEYWRFIKAKKLRGKSAILTYVRRPLGEQRDRIRDELSHLVPEGLRRG